jgi:site-specific DNA-methyltransferase (adenine-specific)
LQEVGAFRSIGADGDGVIRVGNETYRAALDLGYKVKIVKGKPDELVVVQRDDLHGKQAIRAAVLDNLAADSSAREYDADILAAIARDDDVVAQLVNDDSQIAALVRGVDKREEAADAGELVDKAAELQKKWRVARGDLWEIASKSVAGKCHRILCGDSTSAEDVQRVMDGEKVREIVASPPYPGADMWQEQGESAQSRIDRLDVLNKSALQRAWCALEDNGVVCWNIQDIPFGNHGVITTTTTTTIAVKEIGFSLRGEIIWDKAIPHLPAPAFMRRPCVPNQTHEVILVLFKGDWKPREKISGLSDKAKSFLAQGVWRIATERAKKIGHKAPFPVELAQRCIELFSIENDVVLDLFLGSGTTLVACEQAGRVGRGIEIEPKYVAVALERLSALGLECKRVEENGNTKLTKRTKAAK